VDPLSRLPRIPQHNSPLRDDIIPISADERKQKLAQEAEDRIGKSPAKRATFTIWWWEGMMDRELFTIQMCSKVIKDALPSPFPESDNWSYLVDAVMRGEDTNWDEQAHLLVALNPEVVERFVQGYQDDPFFKQYYANEIPNPNIAITLLHFRKGSNRLLYFIDA